MLPQFTAGHIFIAWRHFRTSLVPLARLHICCDSRYTGNLALLLKHLFPSAFLSLRAPSLPTVRSGRMGTFQKEEMEEGTMISSNH